MNRGRRARLAGQVGGGSTRNQKHLLPCAYDFLHRERDTRIRYVDDRIDAVIVEPVPRNRRADFGLVLMVGADELDLFAADGAAEIGDRHVRRLDRPRPPVIGVEARHVA